MPYDLIPLLTTIAGASASFVAILGGFIVSKLITVNGERNLLSDKLKEVNEDIALKRTEMLRLGDEVIEEDAIKYILEHIADVANARNLATVYESERQEMISIENLSPYWDRAIALSVEFDNCCMTSSDLNEDDIPTKMATRIKDLPFEYEVCEALSDEKLPHSAFTVSVPRITGAWYHDNQQKIQELSFDIRCLELERRQLETRIPALKKPAGMSTGLWIFALFSAFNIITPLVLSTIQITTTCQFNTIRCITISLLVAGLIAVFWYLSQLLRWKYDTDSNSESN